MAQVLSHLGSGAVIRQRRLEDVLAGRDTPDDFAPGVWDTWTAKNPLAQRDEALAADAGLLARLQTVAPQERDRFTFAMGPMSFGFDQFVGPRLEEDAFPHVGRRSRARFAVSPAQAGVEIAKDVDRWGRATLVQAYAMIICSALQQAAPSEPSDEEPVPHTAATARCRG